MRTDRRTLAAVGLLYLAVAVLITWPLAAQLSTHLAGFPYGDGPEMARHIWWYNHALRTGQPVFFQPLLGYPDGMEGVLLWAHPLQFFPAWLFAYVLPLPAAANLAILLSMALNGWAMYCLGRHLFAGQQAPSLLAGVVFMAAPTFQGHLGGGHAGLMVMWPVPLYVLALSRLREISAFRSPGWRRWLILSTVFFVLSPGGHILQLIYVLLPVTALFALRQWTAREWTGLLRTVIAAGLGCAVLLIFVLPIARATFETSAYTDEGGFIRYSADLLSVVSPSFRHPLYGLLDYPRRVLGVNLEEGSSYIGIVAGLFGMAAVWKVRAARWWLGLAVVAWVLSLGPLLKIFDRPVSLVVDDYQTAVTLPWAALQNLPFFSLARTPGRFNFTLALAVAALAGYGAAYWGSKMQQHWRETIRWGAWIASAALILFDYQWYWPLPTFPAAVPGAVQALASRDDIRAVFDVPWDNLVAAKEALYLQTAHQKPLVAGHVTRSTPVNPAKLTLLQTTFSLELLDLAGADVIILHKQHATPQQDALARSALGEPFYEDNALALFETPRPQHAARSYRALPEQTSITDQMDIFLFEPSDGWVVLSGVLASDGREIEIGLDHQSVHHLRVDGEMKFTIPIPVNRAAYHTLTLALDPPCPFSEASTLACRAVAVRRLQLAPLIPDEDSGVRFEHGVTLVRAFAPDAVAPGQRALPLYLLWRFDEALSSGNIRFIHVVDAQGSLTAQVDSSLGNLPPRLWAETVEVPLPELLEAGTYRVYAGWYTYPDLTRHQVLSEVEGAHEGYVLLGVFDVSES